MAQPKRTPNGHALNMKRVPISSLNPAPYNPRKNLKPGDPEYENLKRSINEFGLVEPIVWNQRTGNVVGGHQRLKILIERGDTETDVSIVDLPLEKERALNIALNKITGDWDLPMLKNLLQEMDTGAIDMQLTGFTEGEIEDMMTALPPPPDQTAGVVGPRRLMKCPQCGHEF